MAKDQQIGLLSDIVNQLRQLNRANVRDKLQENEQAKRQLKLAEVVEDTSVENTGLISGAQDFQRRVIAGQARTEFNAAIKDSPAKLYAQDIQHELTKNNMHFLHSIDTTLTKQFDMWKMLLSGQKTQLAFDQKIQKIDDRRYANGLRNANEKRLEGIRGGASGAALGMAGAGNLIEGEIATEEEDKGLSTGEAVAAGALSAFILGKIKAVASWFGKGIKWGKGILGRFAAIGLSLFSKNSKQRRVLGPAQKKMAKNPRLWPILLAGLVAANIFDGFMGANDELALDGKETASSGDSSIMSSLGDMALTGLDVMLGFSVANWLTKGKLGAAVWTAVKASWKLIKNPALRVAMMGALGTGAILSAPVWGAIILAGLTTYFWEDITGAFKGAYDYNYGAIGTNELEIATKTQTAILGKEIFSPIPDNGLATYGVIKFQQDEQIIQIFKNARKNPAALKSFYESLLLNGFTAGAVNEFMKKAGVSFKAKPELQKKREILLKQMEGKIDPGFLNALGTNGELGSLAVAAKKLQMDKIKQKKLQMAAQNANTPDGLWAAGQMWYNIRGSDKLPSELDFKPAQQFDGISSDDLATTLPGKFGNVITNTDASTNSSTIMIYQDHMIGSGNNPNRITTDAGEIWSW